MWGYELTESKMGSESKWSDGRLMLTSVSEPCDTQDVATFVSKCMTCQQVKIEHQRASGLLQPLEIPMWKWDEISMDFVTGLPTTQKRHDAIWVVVDRLTKSAHFLPIRKNYGISKLAEIFRQEIVRLHGTPTSIVSDRDPKFTSRFWKGLQKAWGTRLKFSTTFHPQTDGQSERTIQTLEDMLRACALEWTGSWDEYLCLVEFAYNNSWHASIKAAPFELLYGRKCRAPICWDEVGERLIEGPELIEITNEKVVVAKEKLKEARSRQKSYADKHRPQSSILVRLEILECIGEVSYRLALPRQLSPTVFSRFFHGISFEGIPFIPLSVEESPTSVRLLGDRRVYAMLVILISLSCSVRSRGSDFDIPVVFSLVIALLQNKVSKLRAGVAFRLWAECGLTLEILVLIYELFLFKTYTSAVYACVMIMYAFDVKSRGGIRNFSRANTIFLGDKHAKKSTQWLSEIHRFDKQFEYKS
ncbi:DNA/RNA polymerases superfamily protein [Tanacetum coccineum]